MPLKIQQHTNATVPLEVEPIRPDTCISMSVDQVLKTAIFHGKESVEFGEFFSVEGTPEDGIHIWEGDFSGVHWIGAGMTEGQILIEGNAGRHVGSEMRGGLIEVSGDASDWVGAELKGGLIKIQGNAGHLAGAAYRGSPRGMTGGSILIQGTAGNEVGHTMRRGIIATGGLGDLAGFNMLAGTILCFGSAGIRPGAGMRRGTIGFFGAEPVDLLPTFRYACRQNLDILRVIEGFLETHHYDGQLPDLVDLYHGDFLEGGRGEIMVQAV